MGASARTDIHVHVGLLLVRTCSSTKKETFNVSQGHMHSDDHLEISSTSYVHSRELVLQNSGATLQSDLVMA